MGSTVIRLRRDVAGIEFDRRTDDDGVVLELLV